jgi:hypothetical protein
MVRRELKVIMASEMETADRSSDTAATQPESPLQPDKPAEDQPSETQREMDDPATLLGSEATGGDDIESPHDRAS